MKVADQMRAVSPYQGPPCDDKNICLNGGMCVPMLEKHDCRCPSGYMGASCEHRMYLNHIDLFV